MDVESGLLAWKEKIKDKMVWSDSIRGEEFDSFVENIQTICTQAVLNEVQLSIHQKRRADDLQQKSVSRKRLKPFGSGLGLTKEDAKEMIAEKKQKNKKMEEKRQHNQFMKLRRMERDTKYAEEVTARIEERARVKKLKSFKLDNFLIHLNLIFLSLIQK